MSWSRSTPRLATNMNEIDYVLPCSISKSEQDCSFGEDIVPCINLEDPITLINLNRMLLSINDQACFWKIESLEHQHIACSEIAMWRPSNRDYWSCLYENGNIRRGTASWITTTTAAGNTRAESMCFLSCSECKRAVAKVLDAYPVPTRYMHCALTDVH